jgi:hypothetical protein
MLIVNNNGFKVWWDHYERIIGPIWHILQTKVLGFDW